MEELGNPGYVQPTMGEITHDLNVITLDVLSEMEAHDKKHRRKEHLWKASLVLSAAAFITGLAVEASSIGRKTVEEEVGGITLVGSAFLAPTSVFGYYRNRDRGQGEALRAAALSLSVNNTIQPWIAKRLTERDNDIQKRRQNIG